MKTPKNVMLPLSDYHARWYYSEIVARFSGYKEPIRSVRQLSTGLHLPYWEVVRVVKMDKSHTYLDTDNKYVWLTNKCCKIRA